MRIAVGLFALLLGVPVYAQEAPLSAADCASLAAALKLPNTTVTAAQPVAAGQFKAPGGARRRRWQLCRPSAVSR